MAGKARTTTTIQARGQLSRHHSGLCPCADEADDALQILRPTSWSRHSLPLSFFASGSHPLLFSRTFLYCVPLRGRLHIRLAPFPASLATCLRKLALT